MANKIYTCLWFNNQALNAATFYCSIFPNSAITFKSPMVVHCNLNGLQLMGLNGGVMFPQTEAASLVVECNSQQEIDYYWSNLIANGGKAGQCGWCKDKYGVSWQIVPSILGTLISNPAKAQQVSDAYRTMQKIDIATLVNA